MSFWLRVILASQWLLSVSLLSAQVGFTMPVINNVSTGSIVLPTIKVTGFQGILSAQYAICWDPQVLQFQAVTNMNLPGLDTTKFGYLRIDQGILSFAWPSPNLSSGTTVPDGTAIFRLKMKVIGPTGSGTGLKFMTKLPTAIEVTHTVNNKTEAFPDSLVHLNHGYVAVGFTVADEEPDALSMPLSVFPNPFTALTHVVFGLEKATDVRLRVTDVTGRMVHERTESLSAGQHSLDLQHTQLHGPGAYFLSLLLGDKAVTRPIFLQ